MVIQLNHPKKQRAAFPPERANRESSANGYWKLLFYLYRKSFPILHHCLSSNLSIRFQQLQQQQQHWDIVFNSYLDLPPIHRLTWPPRGKVAIESILVRRRRDTKTDHRKGGSEKQWIRRNVWHRGGGGSQVRTDIKTGHSETDSLRSRNYTVRHGEEKDGLESASNIE